MWKRSVLLGLAFASTLGSIGLAQNPGINNTWPLTWQFMGEPSTYKATYSATSAPFAAATSARTIFAINGSATKVIRVRKITISSSVPTTALAEPLYINKVSSATPSTGTSALLTATPYDSQSAAATAVAESFTANPTDMTLVGEIMAPVIRLLPNSTADSPFVVEFGKLGSSAILRSASQGLTLNLAHVTTSAVLTVAVEWTEE